MKVSKWWKATVRYLCSGGARMTLRESGRQYAWDELQRGTKPDVLWVEASGVHDRNDFDRGIVDVLTLPPDRGWIKDKMAEAFAENARLRASYDSACQTIAKMYAAATGSIGGPQIGVVEDLTAMSAEADRINQLYMELLYTVIVKTPDESRHESALRLIKNAQAFQAAQQGGHVNGF
jgi:hypothetical protein